MMKPVMDPYKAMDPSSPVLKDGQTWKKRQPYLALGGRR